MPFSQCCLPVCKTSIHDDKLFVFPRNYNLRKEWIRRIAPHYPQILALSEKQLLKRLICIRHFEPVFLKGKQRIYDSCPTLITEDEINSGIPLTPYTKDLGTKYFKSPAERDHTYHMQRDSSSPEKQDSNKTLGIQRDGSTWTFQHLIQSVSSLTPK